MQLSALFLLPALVFAQPAKRLDLDHLGKIVQLSSLQVSPDGKSLLLVASRPNYEDNRFDTQILWLDPQTGAQRPLTFDRRKITSPRWSPQGDRIAFLAQATGTEKSQLFVLAMQGGEAQQITKVASGVDAFEWKPDGSRFAFVSADEAEKKTGTERHNSSFEVGNDSIFTQAAPQPKHIWLVAAEGGSPKRLTSGANSVVANSLSWSPDGLQLAFVRSSSAHTGDGRDAVIQIFDIASGKTKPLTGRANQESTPRFSPDGRFIAYEYPALGRYHSTEILVSPAGGGEGRTLTRSIDRNLQLIQWMPDGKSVLVAGNDHAFSGAWIQPLESAATKVDMGQRSFPRESAISAGPYGEIAFIGSTSTSPSEVFWKASAEAAPKQLTKFHDSFSSLALAKTEHFTWSNGALKLDGVLTYPPDFNGSQKYPLVLDIHGGPTAASKQAFSFRPQLLAAQGWVVFEPNYRGSDNLGDGAQSAIIGDAGTGPGSDIVQGVQELKKRGWLDESRIGVSGWSYGGYLTVWLLGNYPAMWRAAIAGAAAIDRTDSYNYSDINVGFGPMLGGSPWTDQARMEKYRSQSASSYLHRIQSPVMILHDTKDERVAITNGYKLYHALRDRNIPVKFVAYPVSGHSPPDPVHQRDVQRRWVEWFQQNFKTQAAPSGGQ